MTTKMSGANFPLSTVERYKDRLKPKHHALLLAKATDSYTTIAANMKIAVGTAKSRTNRARLALHALIELDKVQADYNKHRSEQLIGGAS